MELHEKLRELRKQKGITQEELAQALFVSRTAVSKWESGRGYPSIDSLKDISAYFSVTVDGLLSGEKLISLAEQENRKNIRTLCRKLFGAVDLLSFLLIVLPLYPNTVNGYVYSVNLAAYAEKGLPIRAVYLALFLSLTAVGAVKIIMTLSGAEKGQRAITLCSVFLGALTVVFLALAREAYAVTGAFALLIIKMLILFNKSPSV